MKAQEFYDEQLSNYNLLNLIDPATAKQAMQMMEEYHQAKLNLLTIPVVVKSLPNIVEINFDGHLKCQIETTDKSLSVLKAVNGYGNPVDCNKDKTIITEI